MSPLLILITSLEEESVRVELAPRSTIASAPDTLSPVVLLPMFSVSPACKAVVSAPPESLQPRRSCLDADSLDLLRLALYYWKR